MKNTLIPENMQITPERLQAIKLALIRQYEDQYGVKVISWKEGGKVTTLPIKAPNSEGR